MGEESQDEIKEDFQSSEILQDRVIELFDYEPALSFQKTKNDPEGCHPDHRSKGQGGLPSSFFAALGVGLWLRALGVKPLLRVCVALLSSVGLESRSSS
jgi:hypothetical protein